MHVIQFFTFSKISKIGGFFVAHTVAMGSVAAGHILSTYEPVNVTKPFVLISYGGRNMPLCPRSFQGFEYASHGCAFFLIMPRGNCQICESSP